MDNPLCRVPGCRHRLLAGLSAFCDDHQKLWATSPESRTPNPPHVTLLAHKRSMLTSFANRVAAEARNGS